jgi:hypothetical protein
MPRKLSFKRLRRLVRRFRGHQTPAAVKSLRSRVGREASNTFVLLWRNAVVMSARPEKFSIDRPDLLLFQMGKVGSSALASAAQSRGINCFHCHSLDYDGEVARLSRLFHSEPSQILSALELRFLAKHTTLNMLTRWYKTNAASAGRKVKVISLTRDPVTRHVSHLLQRFDIRSLADWYRVVTGLDVVTDQDLTRAVTELWRQLAQLVLGSKPSVDFPKACARGHAAAMSTSPPHPYLARCFTQTVGPLGWFDQQFRPVFDLDIRDMPELAEGGIAQRELTFADILVVRYEDLTRHLGAIAHFLGVSSLELPPVNVTREKAHAQTILTAARTFNATDIGRAFARELRESDYGRACGYDKLSNPW